MYCDVPVRSTSYVLAVSSFINTNVTAVEIRTDIVPFGIFISFILMTLWAQPLMFHQHFYYKPQSPIPNFFHSFITWPEIFLLQPQAENFNVPYPKNN